MRKNAQPWLRDRLKRLQASQRDRQICIPPHRLAALAEVSQLYPEFEDDGCTNSPDSLFGYSFAWACRLHDYAYCSHARPDDGMSLWAKLQADLQLYRDVRDSLPGILADDIAALYLKAVMELGGHAYNSCRPDPRTERCRHNLVQDAWVFIDE